MALRDTKYLTIIFLLLFIFLAVRNAWVSDDAYITFRSVENLRAGYGPNYNVTIRVQSFTHPLWMLILSAFYFIQVNLLNISYSTGLVFLTLFLSVAFSALAVSLSFNKCINHDLPSVALFSASIILSRAFLDYSTSGLENPLTYFLVIVFLWKFFENSTRYVILVFLSALLALNRLDASLLVFPALAYTFWLERKDWQKNILSLLVGFSPLILWEIFSLFYYGFLFPNTAYAKLNTGIPNDLLIEQGIDYLLNSIHWDPLTLFVIVLAGVGLFIERDRKSVFVYLGIVFYVLYIVKVGGDFMSGRFLAVPFLVAAVLLARQHVSTQFKYAGLAALLILSLFNIRSPLFDPQISATLNYPMIDSNGIADERAFYSTDKYNQGLVALGVRDSTLGSDFAGRNWVFTKIETVSFTTATGVLGYQSGPNIYIIDYYALADPLLARLPVKDSIHWRIGHFEHIRPAGYLETFISRKAQIDDPDLALYYQKLSYVISGPLWSQNRLWEIWKFNTGQYDPLVARFVSRNPELFSSSK